MAVSLSAGPTAALPTALPPEAAACRRERDHGIEVLIGERGLHAGNRLYAFAGPVLALMLAPLPMAGAMAGIVVTDIWVPARLALTLSCGLALVLTAYWAPRLWWKAITHRARFLITPKGLLFESGGHAATQRIWVSPLCELRVQAPEQDLNSLGGLELGHIGQARPTKILRLYPNPTRDAALRLVLEACDELRSKHREPQTVPGTPVPSWPEPLGPSFAQRAKAVLSEALSVFRHPSGLLALDLATLGGALVLAWGFELALNTPWVYPASFALFILGLFARRWDRSYLQGYRDRLANDIWWPQKFFGGALAIGLAAWGLMSQSLGAVVAFTVSLPPLLLAYAQLHRWAKAERELPARKSLQPLLAFSIVPLSWAHEVGMFALMAELTKGFSPIAFPAGLYLAAFVYWPVRVHASLDQPSSSAGRAWFWLVVLWLTIAPFASAMIRAA